MRDVSSVDRRAKNIHTPYKMEVSLSSDRVKERR
jgi:hypothetical protein